MKAIEWKGGRGVFRVSGPAESAGATATMSFVEHWPNGNRINRGVAAQLRIPGERELSLGPGEITFDACNAMGGAVPFEASFEPVAKRKAGPTLEQRVRALEGGRS